ncbi:hypothetical protein NQ317_017001 [Molorchus minor]|uniref:Reverse transcriptase domain-containing protein n=1 Tax=Molorchus minor TaxID=1323400 RepID=A0ABQ9JLJ4_9CUCU|nr:hypothetical protein NQ317_017001 [Molorchus minor]
MYSEEGQFISNIFLVPKPDGSNRLILNLKQLNKYIHTKRFKLEYHKLVRKLISPNCFMAVIDLKDAYYLIPLKSHRKYYRSKYEDKSYNTAPFVFTKLMKPLLAKLRTSNFLSVVYLHDFLLTDKS